MTIKEVCEKYAITQDTLRYYEKSGVIPAVTRSPGGIRNYTQQDLDWVNNAICMRNAGMSVEAIARYVQLYQQGDSTLSERHQLLCGERESLLAQKAQLEEALNLLNYKISRYAAALETGVLSWDPDTEHCSGGRS